MFGEQSAELSLNAPSKCVAAVKADRIEARFLVGGCSIQDDGLNQIHVVRYHSDVNVVAVDAALAHPTGPIQKLATSPQDRTLVLSLAEQATKVSLYKLPHAVMDLTNELVLDSDTTDYGYGSSSHADDYDMASDTQSTASSLQGGNLEQKAALEASPGAKMLDMTWRESFEDDTATPGDVLTVDDQGMVTQWDLSLGTAESVHSVQATSESAPTMSLPRVIWDPHQSNAAAVSWGRGVSFLDVRAGALGGPSTIARAHRYGVTDMDYNPNKPYTLVTSGMDGVVKYWDTRTTRRPLLIAKGGHSHYAWSVRYNPFHDQLVLSTGTDAVVNLWRVSTISSAPLLTLEDAPRGRGESGSETSAPNVRVVRQEMSDSVYSAAWSAADAWQYMAVTYDGRVALHHVPSKEKYKILL